MKKDLFQETVDELDLDKEFEEDFEAKPAKYNIYLYNYDANKNIFGEIKLMASFLDPERAICKAEEYIADSDNLKKYADPNAHFVTVEVETIAETEDFAWNVGTLFAEGIKIK